MKMFITPFGKYMLNRLPFGISSTPEFFQKRMSELIMECEGVIGLIDDVLGKTEEHSKRLQIVLEKLRQEGVALNKQKCIFFSKSIQFLGHIIDEEGVKPDQEKL